MSVKAIALLSGGLDSTLAVLQLRKQGIEVTAVTFLMHFGCDMSDTSSCSSDSTSNAERYGFKVKMSHLADKFTEIVKNPKHGHGKNMNPCIDCRILMLKEAKVLMEMMGADFIATGEVVGQRPMSQRMDTFPRIDREAGLEGMVVRPLCAKQLKPTIPEINGLVDRDKLLNFKGRGRKQQIALAKDFGLTEYPAPAGGCLLTEPNYSYRLKELLEHNPDPSLNDLMLLRVGRQFRLPDGLKFFVGRDEADNDKLEGFASGSDYLMEAIGVGSPVCLIGSEATDDEIKTAARACARFSKAKNSPEVDVEVRAKGEAHILKVKPATDEELEPLRIILTHQA